MTEELKREQLEVADSKESSGQFKANIPDNSTGIGPWRDVAYQDTRHESPLGWLRHMVPMPG